MISDQSNKSASDDTSDSNYQDEEYKTKDNST